MRLMDLQVQRAKLFDCRRLAVGRIFLADLQFRVSHLRSYSVFRYSISALSAAWLSGPAQLRRTRSSPGRASPSQPFLMMCPLSSIVRLVSCPSRDALSREVSKIAAVGDVPRNASSFAASHSKPTFFLS